MAPPHPKSSKFDKLSKQEQRRRIAEGVRSGRMSADEGEAAAKFWKLGSIAAPERGNGVPSLGKTIGGMFGIGDQDDGGIRTDRDKLNKWAQRDPDSRRRKTIQRYTTPPRPLPSLGRNPNYEDIFKDTDQGTLRQAGHDEKLSSSKLMKKYGGFRAASAARNRADAIRDIERKLARGEATMRYEAEQMAPEAAEWDLGGRLVHAGIGKLPIGDRLKKDYQTLAAGFTPGVIQLGMALGEDIAVKPARMIAGTDEGQGLATWDKIVKPSVEEYAKNYGKGIDWSDPSTWGKLGPNIQRYANEHPGLTFLDALIVGGAATRVGSIGRLSVKRSPVTGKRLGPIKGTRESFRPGTYDVLTRNIKTRAGEGGAREVPLPVSRHPIGRGIGKAVDAFGAERMFGQKNPFVNKPGARIFSQERRAARFEAKQHSKEMRQLATQAQMAYASVLDFTGADPTILDKAKDPSLLTKAERDAHSEGIKARETALFYAAQGPEGDPLGSIQAVIDSMTEMRDNPDKWELPDRADTATLQRLDREIAGLKEKRDKALAKEASNPAERAVVGDRAAVASARGRHQATRAAAARHPEGSPERAAAMIEVEEARLNLENKQASLAQKRGQFHTPVRNTPARQSFIDVLDELGAQGMIVPYDIAARKKYPDNPEQWYEENMGPGGIVLEDAAELAKSLSQEEALFHIPNFHLRATLILDQLPDQGRKRSFMEWGNLLRGRGIKKPEIVGMEAALKEMRSEGMKSVTPSELKRRIEDKAMIPDEMMLPEERFLSYTLDGARTDEMTFIWTFDPERWGIKHEEEQSHFAGDVPEGANIIAWARTNVRKTKDGKFILFIEEIQSDWSQGFKAKKDLWDKLGKARQVVELERIKHGQLLDKLPPGMRNEPAWQKQVRAKSPEEMVADAQEVVLREAVRNAANIERQYYRHVDTEPGPYMETDQFVTLAVDRLMKEAARMDLDGVGWTTGAQQRARYNRETRRQIKDLEWIPKTGEIVAHEHGGSTRILESGQMNYDDLKSVMGPDGAKQFIERHRADPGMDSIILPAEGIDVGAAIHDFVYDNVTPRIVAAAGKEHGQKVGKTEVLTGENSLEGMAKTYRGMTEFDPLFEIRSPGQNPEHPRHWTLWDTDQEVTMIDELGNYKPYAFKTRAEAERAYVKEMEGEVDRGRRFGDPGMAPELDKLEAQIQGWKRGDKGVTETVHHLPLPKKIHKKVENQQFTYYRHQIPGEELPRGAVMLLKDKTTRLRLSSLATEETLWHELGHIAFFDLTHADQEILASKRGKLVADLDNADHEAFTQWFVDWTRTGKAPNKDLIPVFEKLRQWLRQVYGALKGLDDLDPEVERVFQRMMGYEGLDVTDVQSAKLGGTGPPLLESERLGVLLSATKEKRERAFAQQESARKAQDIPALQKRVAREVDRAQEAEAAGDTVSANRHWNEARNIAFRLSRKKYQTTKAQGNRVEFLSKQVEDLEDVLSGKTKADPEQMSAALDAMYYLMDERERMILEVFPHMEDIFNERRQLFVQFLIDQGHLPEGSNPSRIMLMHRGRNFWQTMINNLKQQPQVRGQSKRHPTVGAVDPRDLLLHVQNQLYRFQTGDILADPAVALDSYQTARSFYESWRVRKKVWEQGEDVSLKDNGSLNDGWILVKGPDTTINNEIPRSLREWQMLSPEQKAASLMNEAVDGATHEEFTLEELAEWNREWVSDVIKDGQIDTVEMSHFLNKDGTIMPGVRQVPQWVVDSYLPDRALSTKDAAAGGKVLDNATALARMSLLTTNLGYVPSNIVGNLAFLLATAGPQLVPALADYTMLLKSKNSRHRSIFSMIRTEAGTGHFASQSLRSEVLRAHQREGSKLDVLPELNVALNEKLLSPIADDPWRMWAWIEEARRRKYKNPEDWHRLLTAKEGTKEALDRQQIRMDSNSRMVDFDRLATWERNTLGRWLFVYPWLRGATAWMGWYAKNFPERLGASGALANTYMQTSGSDELELPPYLDLLAKSPFGGDRLINTQAISPFSTSYDMFKTAMAIPAGMPNPTEVTAGLLTPPLQLAIQAATRRGTFGQQIGWGDIGKDAISTMVPGGSLAQGMYDPNDISDIYEEKDRKTILMHKALRWIPRKYNEPYLKALADRAKASKGEFGEEQYKEMNAIAAKTGLDGGVPQNVKLAYDFHVQVHERTEALKEAITEQGDFKRTRVGEATLTPRQKLAVVMNTLGDVFFSGSSEWEDAPSIQSMTEGMSDEQVETITRKLESKYAETRYRWRAVGQALGMKFD